MIREPIATRARLLVRRMHECECELARRRFRLNNSFARLGALINVSLYERARYRCIAKYRRKQRVIFYATGQGMRQFTKD